MPPLFFFWFGFFPQTSMNIISITKKKYAAKNWRKISGKNWGTNRATTYWKETMVFLPQLWLPSHSYSLSLSVSLSLSSSVFLSGTHIHFRGKNRLDYVTMAWKAYNKILKYQLQMAHLLKSVKPIFSIPLLSFHFTCMCVCVGRCAPYTPPSITTSRIHSYHSHSFLSVLYKI